MIDMVSAQSSGDVLSIQIGMPLVLWIIEADDSMANVVPTLEVSGQPANCQFQSLDLCPGIQMR